MTAHRWWSCCGIALAAIAFVSCTQGQIEQVLQSKTQDMISGPCPTGSGPVSATPEFCVYVTEFRIVNHDTEADVSATIVNRTGRRVYLRMESWPDLIDSSGTKWGFSSITGIQYGGGTPQPQPLEPNVDSQVAYSFKRSGSGQVPADLTFSMRGELAIVKADSRGELVPGNQRQAVRGFNFSGLRPVQSQPAQPAAASGLQGSTSPQQQSKKQEPPTNSKENSSTAAAAGFKLPGSSKASPDVLGVKLGISTVVDVRAALARVTPSLVLEEQHAQLVGQSSAGRPYPLPVDVQNGKYLRQLSGVTSIYKGGCGSTSESMGSCEKIDVNFSAPPNKGTALSLSRSISFVKGPSLDTMTRSLAEKYGEPGFHGSYGDRGAEQRFAWAWSTEGKPMSLNAQHPCSSQSFALEQNDAAAPLQAGCAAVVHVVIGQRNNVVIYMTVYAIDHVATYSAGTKTTAWVADYVTNFEKQERESAAKIKAPGL